jgi:hypothetical protein
VGHDERGFLVRRRRRRRRRTREEEENIILGYSRAVVMFLVPISSQSEPFCK